MRVRILLLSQFYPPITGGEERHVRNLAASLSHRGHTVSVVTQWVPGTADSEITDDNVTVYRIKGLLQRFSGLFSENERRHAPPFPDPELVAGLRRMVVQFNPDVVHAHNWLVRSFLPLKSWSGASLVVTLHDYNLICPKKNFLYNGKACDGLRVVKCWSCTVYHYGKAKSVVTTLGNFTFVCVERRTVDKFIAVSHSVARYNRLAEFELDYEVVPNFIPDDVTVLRSDPDPCVDQLPVNFILFVGDLMRLKGVPVLLDAYAQLEGAPPLVLIGRRGPGMPDTLPPNVYQFGLWSHNAIMHAWDRCLFGVLPSTGLEASPTVVMEAMASGKPVVGTSIGGIPDIIVDGETGFLVRPDDVGTLRAALQTLLSNRDMVTRMGQTSLKHIAKFKAGSVVPQIERVYQTCSA
jgi:glycosyltransferase involved in cell wall biosynthesis